MSQEEAEIFKQRQITPKRAGKSQKEPNIARKSEKHQKETGRVRKR